MATMTKDITVRELVGKSHTIARELGWWEVPRAIRMARLPEKAIPEKLALIHSEVSEALEEYRVHGESEKLSEITYYNNKPDGFAVEMADIVIRVADLCGALGIDLTEAILVKSEYNITRRYKHGGKV